MAQIIYIEGEVWHYITLLKNEREWAYFKKGKTGILTIISKSGEKERKPDLQRSLIYPQVLKDV